MGGASLRHAGAGGAGGTGRPGVVETRSAPKPVLQSCGATTLTRHTRRAQWCLLGLGTSEGGGQLAALDNLPASLHTHAHTGHSNVLLLAYSMLLRKR